MDSYLKTVVGDLVNSLQAEFDFETKEQAEQELADALKNQDVTGAIFAYLDDE